MFHKLRVVDTDKQAEVTKASFEHRAVVQQVLPRGGNSGRTFIGPNAIAFPQDSEKLRKGQNSLPGNQMKMDQSFKDGIRKND